jgi:predicted PurR-regulated permease PerM
METNNQRIIFDISAATIAKIAAAFVILIFLYLIRDILTIFIVALLLSTLINPLADWFARHKIPRALAVLLIYIFLVGILALIATLLIPPLAEQAQQLLKNLSGYWGNLADRAAALKSLALTKGLLGEASEGLSAWQNNLPKALSGVFETISEFLGGVITFILILVLTFYMVVENEALKKFFKSVAPERFQPHLVGIFTRAQHKIGLWLRGSLALGFIVGAFVYIGLTILGVKYALVLALFAGVFELIPYFGPPISAIPAVFIAFSQAPLKGMLTIVLYVVVQQLENNILVPKVMQRAVGLNPIVSILSLGIGFKVAGFLGALLAIPMATAVSVIVTDFIELRRRGQP